MISQQSHSSLGMYRSCPKKFSFNYVEKIKTPARLTPDAHLGSVIHRVLNKLYRLGADGILLSLDEALENYQSEWDKVDPRALVLTSDYYTIDDFIRIGRKMLSEHYKKYQPFDRGKLLGTEMHLTFTLPGTTFRIKAVIDRLVQLQDGTIEICDYKTGKQIVRPTDPAFVYQMGIYQLAVQVGFEQFNKIRLVQHFLRTDQIISCVMSPEQMDELTLDLRDQIVATHQAERFNDFPTRESPLCNYCEYYSLCPAKRHRQLLDEEADSDSDDVDMAKTAKGLADRYIDISEKQKQFKAERESLKEDIVRLVKETGWTSLKGDQGTVKVSLSERQKFLTKSEDETEFAELSKIAREFGLENYFTLDTRMLMKEIFQKKRLNNNQMEELGRFVSNKEESRVTVKLDHNQNHEEESESS